MPGSGGVASLHGCGGDKLVGGGDELVGGGDELVVMSWW